MFHILAHIIFDLAGSWSQPLFLGIIFNYDEFVEKLVPQEIHFYEKTKNRRSFRLCIGWMVSMGTLIAATWNQVNVSIRFTWTPSHHCNFKWIARKLLMQTVIFTSQRANLLAILWYSDQNECNSYINKAIFVANSWT